MYSTKLVIILSLFYLNSMSGLAQVPPKTDFLFTAHINVAKPLDPIPVPGGVTVVEPFTPGTISGRTLNGTIAGGLAYPNVFRNQTLQVPAILLYGTTVPDKVPFLVTGSAIGLLTEQVARLEVRIGGTYARLEDIFILATIVPAEDRKTVVVNAFEAMF